MKKTWLKYVGYVVGAIILGAIGSGVWDKLLSPLWNILIDGIIKLFSLTSTSFTDMIYANAAKGFHEQLSLLLIIALIAIIGCLYLDLFFKEGKYEQIDKDNRTEDTIDKFIELGRKSLPSGPFVFIALIVFGFLSIQTAYVNKVITNSLNSIEIVSPHIGIQKTLELRSKFYSIQTLDDYKDFYEKGKKLEEAFKLKLHLSTPL